MCRIMGFLNFRLAEMSLRALKIKVYNFILDVATDRILKRMKDSSNSTMYSVQQMISCVIQKSQNDGCSGSTVDLAWGKVTCLLHLKKVHFIFMLLDYLLRKIVEEKCQKYTNGNKKTAEECRLRNMINGEINCPDHPEITNYKGAIILASPFYKLKVESDVILI